MSRNFSSSRPSGEAVDTDRRRALKTGMAAVALGLASFVPARAVTPEPTPFSFDALTDEMRALAGETWREPVRLEGFLGDLEYDDYRLIRFNDAKARWSDADGPFHLHAFHTGWLFGAPVRLFEVEDGMAREMTFSTADFEYLNELADRVPADAELPGVAGFRLNTPINRPDKYDELAAFLGASYFRALGRGSVYGASARGIAVDTATARPEEFPHFTRFWLERPKGGGDTITVYAALDGPSVTGAYRFVIRPGAETVMDVTARLFMREDVAELGMAPLTSMMLFGDANRSDFDDYRAAVRDSEALRVVRADGDVLWRPLNNPAELGGAYLFETSPRAFGLHQRERDPDAYHDAEAHYERRPSIEVEPLGDWGPGAVRLVEIPTDLEANDNIVAYWVREEPVRAGDALEYEYRLRWGDLPTETDGDRAVIIGTRAGAGGPSGVPSRDGTRKFVVDFAGGPLAKLPADAEISAEVSISTGELVSKTLERLETGDAWRLVIDVSAEEGDVVELVAHLAGFGRKLSEIWLYQWINA